MGKYETIQGDTWDAIAFKVYGEEKYMRYLMEANWSLLDIMMFSDGNILEVPDLPEETDEDIPDWRIVPDEEDVFVADEEGDFDG